METIADAALPGRSIDRLIEDLSARRPDEAVIVDAIERFDECRPAVHAVLRRAGNGERLEPPEENLLFFGLFILAARRDSTAFPLLLRMLRLPPEEVDRLLGDAITENLAAIAASLFDGNTSALLAAVADRTADEFVRDALLGAATFLAWEGRVDRLAMSDFLRRFHEEGLAPDDDYAWIAWLTAIALLNLRTMVPLARDAWDRGRVPSGVMSWSHFEENLELAGREWDDIGRFHGQHLGYMDDALRALRWTLRATESRLEEEEGLLDDETVFADLLHPVGGPTVSPWRHVGRNDPCLCGSGKKFKKCCLPKYEAGLVP